MYHNIWHAVVLMAVCAALAAAQPARGQNTGALRVGYTEPDTLDPHVALSGSSPSIVRFLYRGLTRFAIRDGRVTTSAVDPDLAGSWIEPDADDLTWVFRLRRGIQFHKGFGELTAEDVKFSFERQMNDPQHMVFANNLDVISSIEVVNNYTLWITLKYPDPVFLFRVAGFQQGYIVSKKAVQQYGERFPWNPVGTGPFYFEQRIKDEKIILKSHEAYEEPQRVDESPPRTRPNLDEVHWFDVRDSDTMVLGLKYGAFDIIYPNVITPALFESAKQIGAVLDKRGPGLQWSLFFNTGQKPFDAIEVRRAVMYAIDRNAIKEAVWLKDMAMLAVSPVPPGYVGHTPVEILPHDPERARALLTKAGHSGLFLQAHFISEAFEYPKIMALVQQQLNAVGIELPLVPVKNAIYHERIQANQNAIVLHNAARLPHADVMLSLFYHSSQAPNPRLGQTGTNFSHYRDMDDLLEQARQTANDDDREKLYHEAQQRLMRDAVVLPIVIVPDMSLRNPKRVRSPFDPEMGEAALHYFYNYPELFELVRQSYP